MADIVLLDDNGTSATYQNVDSITVPTSSGGTATFTTGGGGTPTVMSAGAFQFYNGYVQSEKKFSSIPSVIFGELNLDFTGKPEMQSKTYPVSLIYCDSVKRLGYFLCATTALWLMTESLSSATVEITNDGYLKITSSKFTSSMAGKYIIAYYIE